LGTKFKEAVVIKFKLIYYPGIFVEKLKKTAEHCSQDNQSTGQDLNLGPLKFQTLVLTTLPKHWVMYFWEQN
jgi:hypothetical protein